LVVAGGPGTGKTAVALHRAAYLLYTYRRRLSGQGVLLVGPSSIFLRYIDQVLPSLGEDEVALATPAALKPRLRVRAVDPPAAADDASHDDPSVAAALARGDAAPEDWELDLTARLRRLPEIRAALERMWPVLSGAELVHDLLGFAALVRSAAGGLLGPEEQLRLVRPRSGSVAEVAWTDGDLALVDEADAILGPRSAAHRRPGRRRHRREELEAARRVVEDLGVGGFTSAAEVLDRYGSDAPAAADDDGEPRIFGHVLADEAQDLTAM